MSSLNILSSQHISMAVFNFKKLSVSGHIVDTTGHYLVIMSWSQVPRIAFQLRSFFNASWIWAAIYSHRLLYTYSKPVCYFLQWPLPELVRLCTSFRRKTGAILMTLKCYTKCFIKWPKCHESGLWWRYTRFKTIPLYVFVPSLLFHLFIFQSLLDIFFELQSASTLTILKWL